MVIFQLGCRLAAKVHRASDVGTSSAGVMDTALLQAQTGKLFL